MASLPISSMHSRRAYFRSVETSKACLCELSSRLSSSAVPPDGRQHRFGAGQCGEGAELLLVARPEELGQVEAQHGLAAPLAALDQQPLLVVHQQHPARRRCRR